MRKIALLTAALLIGSAALFGADPQLLNMAPSDAQMFAGINVEQAKTSQFGQFLLSSLPIDAGFEEFIHSTGFDPRTDLREILVVTNGAPSPNVATKTSMSGLVMAKGTFNIPQILAAAGKDKAATVSTYAGAQMITMGSDHAQALGLIDGSTVVAGDADVVKAALDRRSQSNPIPASVMARINQLSTTEDAWSISTANFGALSLPGAGANSSGSAVLGSIQQASGGVKFGTQVQLDAQAVTGTAQDATSLGDTVKLLAQMIQMHGSSNPVPGQVTDLLKSLSVSTDQNVLKINLTLPEDQLESLFKMAEAHHTTADHI